MRELTKIAVLGAIISAFSNHPALAHMEPKANEKVEKCYGVVKARKNDCSTSRHSCAGQAKTDGAADEWVRVPTGLCLKLVNGSLTPKH